MKSCKRFISIMLSLVLAIAMVIPATAVKKTDTVRLNKTSATVYVGGSTTLKLSGTAKNVQWSSAKKSVATVSKKGKVTGVKKGETTVTAKVGNKSYKCKVTVKNVALNKKNISITSGETKSIKLMGSNVKSVKSSDKSIATAKKYGKRTVKITAAATGTAKITVVGANGKKYTCKVNVVAENALSAPSAYPLPQGEETSLNLGVFQYDQTYYVTLTSEDDANIYYEVAEGKDAAAVPTTQSKQFSFEQYQLVMLEQPEASPEGDVTKVYNIKAICEKDGVVSEVSNFNYTVTSHPHHTLKVGHPVDANGTELTDATLIQDYDNDKIYLIQGKDRAVVVDAGYFDADDQGNLYETARKIVGNNTTPIDLVIAHPHPDHVQMTHQFLCEENKNLGGYVYVNERGIEVLREYVLQYGVASGMFASEQEASDAYDAQLKTLGNGDILDLGGKSLDVIELPGHQVAGVMLYDKDTGYLYTTDQVGNNRAHRADSFWMQFGDLTTTFFADPIDVYESSLAIALERLDTLGNVTYILSGHNDLALKGTEYIDNLKTAVQTLVDEGTSCLHTPLNSLDMGTVKENTKTVVVGDRLTDPNWAAINVNLDNYLSDGYRDGNEKSIADLSNLSVHQVGAKGNLLWDDENFGINVNWEYPTDGTKPTRKTTTAFTANVSKGVTEIEVVPTSCASAATITINGQAVAKSGEATIVTLNGTKTEITVDVTATDGMTTKQYTVTVNQS